MPQDYFTLLCFSVSQSHSKLERPNDIESPLTAKAIMRVLCEGKGEGQGSHRHKDNSEELDLADPLGLKGLSSPKEPDNLTLGHLAPPLWISKPDVSPERPQNDTYSIFIF